MGDTCDADKECLSYNCLASGTCGDRADTPREVAKWVYVVVAICIFGGMWARCERWRGCSQRSL